MANITLTNVHKQFGDVKVIKGVDLEIKDHEFVVFVGPSGCGKSTMLRLIAGLEEATEGQIIIDGEDVTALSAAERGLSMVFQSYALYPHKTVGENMGFPLKVAGRPAAEIKEKVTKAAEVLKLEPLLDRKPKDLSGGQRQRVAIGRSIVRDPKAFLFDEPLSNLDAALRVDMRVQIARLRHQLNATMIYVTHDQVEAMTLANRIIVFSAGKIEQVGHPLDLYRDPSNLFVATFIGSPKMNVLPCTAGDGDKTIKLANNTQLSSTREAAKADKTAEQVDDTPAFVGIRPEHINIVATDQADKSNTLQGVIGIAEHLGSDSFIHVDIEEVGTIVVRADPEAMFNTGDEVTVQCRPEYVFRFAESGNTLV